MNPVKRQKILFVHSQLVQHGSERYLYEICRALDKDRFEVHVMTRKFFIRRQYYYDKLLKEGVSIYCKLISRRHLRYPIKWIYNRLSIVRRLIELAHRFVVKAEYGHFFDSYDLIAVVGIETYCDALSPYLDKKNNVVIHHVNHQFQFERDYFSECRQKRLVVLDAQQEMEVKRSNLRDAALYRFPLSMKLVDRPVVIPYPVTKGRPVRIGVVSRLFRDRPNEPLFRCFAAVANDIDAVLIFYGGGDSTQYSNLLTELAIKEKVYFKGHQEDLESAIVRDELSVMWLVSMGPSVSYGSIEVASLGLPMVFWNLSKQSYDETLEQTDNALHSFSNIPDFVAFNQHIINNPQALLKLGADLRQFVIKKFEISNYIGQLEAYYQRISENELASPVEC